MMSQSVSDHFGTLCIKGIKVEILLSLFMLYTNWDKDDTKQSITPWSTKVFIAYLPSRQLHAQS